MSRLGLKKIGGNILPIAKWDARIGNFFLVNRVQDTDGWQSETVNIANEDFRAIFDLKNLLVGWIDLPKGQAPDLKMVKAGDDFGDPPSASHKLGIRLIAKMDDTIDGSMREILSTSIALQTGIEELFDLFADERGDHPDKVPVVILDTPIKHTTPHGDTYQPVFLIEEWVERPDDLPIDGIPPSGAAKKKPAKSAGYNDQIPF